MSLRYSLFFIQMTAAS